MRIGGGTSDSFASRMRLGNSGWFVIVGYNYGADGASATAFNKPPRGATACQTLARTTKRGLAGHPALNPIPAHQIDGLGTGFIAMTNSRAPLDRLWFVSVTRNAATGAAVFGPARAVVVAPYRAPPPAAQPGIPQTLRPISSAALTNAVMAINPRRGGKIHSFWTAHTVRVGNFSGIRWYEINPLPAVPVVLRSGTIASNNASFLFNAAISPDRRVDGTKKAFGDSFVIHYNVTSPVNNLGPRIMAASATATDQSPSP